MPWMAALLLALGVLAAAGSASATIYVPGHIRDGVYTRPHFVASPEARYDRDVKVNVGQGKLPKRMLENAPPLPPKKLPAEAPS